MTEITPPPTRWEPLDEGFGSAPTGGIADPEWRLTRGGFWLSLGLAALVGAIVAVALTLWLDDDTSDPGPASAAADVENASTDDSSATGSAPQPTQAPAAPSAPTGAATQPSTGLVQDVLARVGPAVVSIEIDGTNGFFGGGAGSGFVISPDGNIVTNAHVVASGGDVTVVLPSGERLAATVVGVDDVRDIAVLDVEADDLPVVQYGSSEALVVGDQVVAIGNALGFGGSPTVTSGIVSALDRTITADGETLPQVLQIDAAINPGNSGGPLVNAQGQVIGINTAIAGNADGIGFAIPIDQASRVIEGLRAGRVSPGPVLGVSVVDAETVDPDFAERYDIEAAGAFVEQVTSPSAADSAGLRRGDIVVEVDGEAITSANDLIGAVRARFPGDEVTVSYIREGELRTVTALLGEGTGG